MEQIIINGLICEQSTINNVKKKKLFFLRKANAKAYYKSYKWNRTTWACFAQGTIMEDLHKRKEVKDGTIVYVVVMN